MSQGEAKIWHHHAELSILGHNPHVLTSPFCSTLCFPKSEETTTEFVCGTKKGLHVTEGEVHFSITSQLHSIHDNSKTTTGFSHAAQAHCKISIKLFTIVSNIPQYLEQAEKCLNSSISSK